jgi:hypothetical protein
MEQSEIRDMLRRWFNTGAISLQAAPISLPGKKNILLGHQ